LTEQQQTTTPGPTAPDAPAEATEAEAPAGPAVAVVEDSLVATAADGSPEQPTLEPESLEVEPSVTQPEAAQPEPEVQAAVAQPEAAQPEPEVQAEAETRPVVVAQSEAAQPEPEIQAELAQPEAAQPEPETPPAAVAQSEAAQPELETPPAAVAQSEAAQPELETPPAAVAQSEAAQPELETPPAAVAQSEAAQPELETPAAREPATMAELLAEQDATIRSFKHGDVVEGSVVRIDREEILVDIGAKSEGVVSNRELYGRNAETAPSLAVGDTVLVYVLQPESPEGHAVLSLRRAGLERKWRAMQEQFEAGLIIEAPVIDHNKGGLIVDCGIRGFVPISQIVDFPRRPQNEQPRDAAQEIAEKLQPYVGRRLRLKILEVNRKANRLILSEKVALYEERREKRDELFSSLQVGQRVTGSVRSIAPFGIFIDLGGIDGLVHKSELSWNKVNNPEAGYKVGSEVEAEVIDINHERGRISLSIRRLQPDPWHSTVASFRVGDVIEGTVTKLVNFGAFVRVRDGLEGLIHISELSHQRVAHPGDVVREGQTLKMKIISLDSERHRLGLSLKQAEEPPPRPAPEPRPRRERPDRGYSISDAVQEPEGGIDKTLAAAFAQVRQQLAEAQDDRSVADQPAEAAVADQPAEAALVDQPAEPAVEAALAEPAIADQPGEPAVAEADEPPVEPALADQPAEPPADEAAERV
jgi:small subunit ribosomal protein S1